MVNSELTQSDIKAVSLCCLFDGCREDRVEAYLRDVGVRICSFPAGEAISHELRNGAYGVVIFGSVRIFSDGEGRSVLLNVVGKNELFDIASITGGEGAVPLSAVRTAGKSRIAFVRVGNVKDLMTQYPDIAANCLRFFCDRVKFLNRRIRTISCGTAEQKLADYLLSEFEQENGEYLVRLKSCVELAKRLNMSRASLYRALGCLEQSQMISRNAKLIRLLDIEALQSV